MSRQPRCGDRFWPKDGSDDWHRVWTVRPYSISPPEDSFVIVSMTGKPHHIKWSTERNRWEEVRAETPQT